MPELDVCPVCGYVTRARLPKPGLCAETWRHPGSGGVEPTGGTQKITTDGRARTQLVRVLAVWTMP